MRNVFVALGERNASWWTLWGHFMKSPVAFVWEGPLLNFTFTQNRFYLWKMVFIQLPRGLPFSLCVLYVSPPWLPLSPILAFMISRTFSWIVQVLLISRQKDEPEISFYLITTKCFFSLQPEQPGSKLQRRHLSIIWDLAVYSCASLEWW